MEILALVVGLGVGALCAHELHRRRRKAIAMEAYAQGLTWAWKFTAGLSREDCDRQAPCPYQD